MVWLARLNLCFRAGPNDNSMDWHRRYLQQASWTRDLRDYLLKESGLSDARRVLEVGCGTGAILQDVAQIAPGPRLHGLDVDAKSLLQARLHAPSTHLCQGDAHALPYPDGRFDITYCHFVLLWLDDPVHALQEMRRVTRSRGHVLAIAEPDYTARVDRPGDLALLGRMQERSLQRQGADTSIGSRLAALFHASGMKIVEAGTMKPQAHSGLVDEEFENEWAVLREDLKGMLAVSELDQMMKVDADARRSGAAAPHVPTYFAHAQV